MKFKLKCCNICRTSILHLLCFCYALAKWLGRCTLSKQLGNLFILHKMLIMVTFLDYVYGYVTSGKEIMRNFVNNMCMPNIKDNYVIFLDK